MKRLAKAIVEEVPEHLRSAALRAAAQGTRLEHAERDLLRLFRAMKMSLPVPINLHSWGLLFVPHMSVKDWFHYLLRSRSELVLGGFGRRKDEARLAMATFWENLRGNKPDHQIYRTHSDRLSSCFPFYLFLDEGVGLRKTGVLIISLQFVLGVQTAELFAKALEEAHAKARGRRLSGDTVARLMTESQQHNNRGITYSTRFLYTVLPKKMYKKTTLLEKVLTKLADEITDVMCQGLQVSSDTFYGVCLGVKGDAPMQAKISNATRSFQHMGFNKGVCMECEAGLQNYNFEDTALSPAWEPTIYRSRPYTVPSPLLKIPCQPSAPEAFFCRDPFHTFKQSIGCSFVSSTIVMIGELKYWPGQSEAVAEILNRAYADFAFFVKKEWPGRTTQSLRGFTRELFHWPRKDKFPAGRFKGSDCMLLLRWICHLVTTGFFLEALNPSQRQSNSPLLALLEAWHKPYFELVLKAASSGVEFFHILHRSGVWLCRQQAKQMGLCAAGFTQAFSQLAQLCWQRTMPRYHLVPALHAYHHFWMDAKRFLDRRPPAPYFLNPATSNCEADEDFVGKIARLSRKVHARSASHRTLERYAVKMYCEFEGFR